MIKTFGNHLLLSTLLLISCTNQGGKMNPYSDGNFPDAYDILPEVLIPNLPGRLHETSGLALFNGLFWTINDSGGEAAIYGFDPVSGAIQQTIRVENAVNNDWESLASDDQSIYIGDFGNNYGKRKDLAIYRLLKSEIPSSGDTSVNADKIGFSYPDQERFKFTIQYNSFDCEAFVCLGDSLYLFTKDWINENTSVYRLPAKPGNHIAEHIDSFTADGLISGADINPNHDKLVLLGYKDYYPFIWCFSGFENRDFFSGETVRFNLEDSYRAQTEAIVFSGNDTVFISAERSRVPSRLYRVILPPEIDSLTTR